MKTFAIWYLLTQSIGCAAWWGLLLGSEQFRKMFVAEGAPDAVILALGPADAIFFLLLPSFVIYGLRTDARWSWPLLCVHAGAAAYASLYAITLAVLTRGELWLGGVMMIPCSFVPIILAWKLRPPASMR